MVRARNVSNFDWLLQFPERWHRKKLMIDYSIPITSFIGLNKIYSVIGMNYERSFPVDRSTKRTLPYATEELWQSQTKTNKDFL